jgi:hypothetical protein
MYFVCRFCDSNTSAEIEVYWHYFPRWIPVQAFCNIYLHLWERGLLPSAILLAEHPVIEENIIWKIVLGLEPEEFLPTYVFCSQESDKSTSWRLASIQHSVNFEAEDLERQLEFCLWFNVRMRVHTHTYTHRCIATFIYHWGAVYLWWSQQYLELIYDNMKLHMEQ